MVRVASDALSVMLSRSCKNLRLSADSYQLSVVVRNLSKAGRQAARAASSCKGRANARSKPWGGVVASVVIGEPPEDKTNVGDLIGQAPSCQLA